MNNSKEFWVLTQNRSALIICTGAYIEPMLTFGQGDVEIYCTTSEKSESIMPRQLGKYSSERRCKEVLMELAEHLGEYPHKPFVMPNR